MKHFGRNYRLGLSYTTVVNHETRKNERKKEIEKERKMSMQLQMTLTLSVRVYKGKSEGFTDLVRNKRSLERLHLPYY